MKTYSVIDIETTGLGKYDKIVELAIVKIDEAGNILDTYNTLVNPDRDLSGTHIHGITATMVKSAPFFREISHFIVDYLNGTIPVSHNKVFDFKFLEREIIQSGIDDFYMDGLCTLNLSRRIFPDLPCRKLGSLCECFDIDLEDAHSALDDSIAAAKLLSVLIDESAFFSGKSPLEYRLDSRAFERIEFTREESDTLRNSELTRIASLIKHQPDISTSKDYNVSEYLNLLDRVLEDRIVTDEEFIDIKEFLTDFNISSAAIQKIHEEYFRRLCSFYLEDEVISELEATDLDLVGKLLGINEATRRVILALERSNDNREKKLVSDSMAGKAVCFTGTLIGRINGELIDRSKAHQMAIERGLKIKKGVSRNLDYLVVADPNTKSGKAKKAREISVPIIAERVFWNKIGVPVD